MTFKEYIKQNNLSTSIVELNCSYNELSDLNGIEEFKCLELLYCNNNNLTSLPDLSELKCLKLLYCVNNDLPYDLTGLDVDEQIILINRYNNINTILDEL